MDNGNDPPTCIPCLEISDENMIPCMQQIMALCSDINECKLE